MKKYCYPLVPFLFIVVLNGCQSEEGKNEETNTVNEQITKQQTLPSWVPKKKDLRPLSERKTGDLISQKMIALSDYDFDTNQDIFVNISGRLINLSKKQTWAIIKDKDVYYFAYGHAGMEMFPANSLEKKVYIRAIVEQRTLDGDDLYQHWIRGLKKEPMPESISINYRLNTTKFAIAETTSADAFIKSKGR